MRWFADEQVLGDARAETGFHAAAGTDAPPGDRVVPQAVVSRPRLGQRRDGRFAPGAATPAGDGRTDATGRDSSAEARAPTVASITRCTDRPLPAPWVGVRDDAMQRGADEPAIVAADYELSVLQGRQQATHGRRR
jgi:hypothetical protein